MAATSELAKNYHQGQSNPRARLTDREVEAIRQLREDGHPVAWIAAKFEIHKGHVSRLVRFLRR